MGVIIPARCWSCRSPVVVEVAVEHQHHWTGEQECPCSGRTKVLVHKGTEPVTTRTMPTRTPRRTT